MSAWRKHARFEFADTEGVLRVLRDVVIRRLKNGDIVATSSDPCVIGELVTVHLVASDSRDVRARVVDSRPVLVDGFVRHRLRLAVVTDEQQTTEMDDMKERGVAEAK